MDSLTLVIMPNTKPFIAAALVCEKVLQEKDGVLSIMRVVDTYTVPPLPPKWPQDITPVIELHVVVMLKAGELEGKYEVEIKLRNPKGDVKPVAPPFPMVFGGKHTGSNVAIQLQLGVKTYGLHWFDVDWNGEFLTSVPLLIVEGARQAETANPSPGEQSV